MTLRLIGGVLFLSASQLAAQSTAPSVVRNCQATATDSLHGVVRGVVIDDSTGRPIAGQAAFLDGVACLVSTDDSGRFIFANAPVGEHRLRVGRLGYRRLEPPVVRVMASAPAYIEVRLRPENRITDCLGSPPCATLLRPPRTGSTLTDAERLRESALRTSVAIAVTEGWRLGDFAVCMDEPNPRIRRALIDAIPKVVPADECALPAGDSLAGNAALTHRPTGMRAVSFAVEEGASSGDQATVRVTNYVGPLSASGWTCQFRREQGAWIAKSCRLNWIS